ncbi:GerMN domain-containing protein, partial [Lentzea aerocolonigenes]
PPHKPGPATLTRPPRNLGLAALTRPLRNLALAAVALTALTACGIRPTEPIPGLEAPSGPVENTSPSLYWVSDGKVIPVSRPLGSVSGYDVIALLAQGPTNAEQSRGLSTEVPFDAAPAVVDRVASGLDVTLSSDVSQLSPVAVQQIVCTLLGIQSAGTVNLRGGGHSLEARKCA